MGIALVFAALGHAAAAQAEHLHYLAARLRDKVGHLLIHLGGFPPRGRVAVV